MKKTTTPKAAVALALAAFATLSAALLVAEPATAQSAVQPADGGPTINLGRGFRTRFFNRARYVGDTSTYVGETKLIVEALLDMPPGPVVLSLQQGGRTLASTTCDAGYITDTALTGIDAQVELRECETEYIAAAEIRTAAPVDIVLAQPAGRELYRGTYPVVSFQTLESRASVEQRALRLDSLFGAGYVRQNASVVEFSYVTTHEDETSPADPWLRCNVAGGAWTPYEARLTRGNNQDLQHRVGTEDGIIDTRVVTDFYSFTTRLPIAVAGRSARPSAGSSADGAWVCQLLSGEGDAAQLVREFRFEVRSGFIQRHALEAQVPAGRGAVLTAIGIGSTFAPLLIDPALVRPSVAGVRLTGATAPILTALPARASGPTFTSPAASAGGRPRRR